MRLISSFRTWGSASTQYNFCKPMYTFCNRSKKTICTVVKWVSMTLPRTCQRPRQREDHIQTWIIFLLYYRSRGSDIYSPFSCQTASSSKGFWASLKQQVIASTAGCMGFAGFGRAYAINCTALVNRHKYVVFITSILKSLNKCHSTFFQQLWDPRLEIIYSLERDQDIKPEFALFSMKFSSSMSIFYGVKDAPLGATSIWSFIPTPQLDMKDVIVSYDASKFFTRFCTSFIPVTVLNWPDCN